jgi:hypothetical protein
MNDEDNLIYCGQYISGITSSGRLNKRLESQIIKKSFGASKSNGRSRKAKIWYGHMCLMEIDRVLIMVENRLNYYV